MKTYPIIYSTPMVVSIVKEIKTITRRLKGLEIVNDNPDRFEYVGNSDEIEVPRLAKKYDDRVYYLFHPKNSNAVDYVCQGPYKTGDVLWIRESWAVRDCNTRNGICSIEYKATPAKNSVNYTKVHLKNSHRVYTGHEKGKWKPSIHMPKEAARIFLMVVAVRVERLCDISENDAVKEGVHKGDNWLTMENLYLDYTNKAKLSEPHIFDSARASFFTLWDLINGEESRQKNPWVWVIEFKEIEKPKNFI